MLQMQLIYQYTFLVIAYSLTFFLQLQLLIRSLKSKWMIRLSACLLINIGIFVVTALYAIFDYGYLLVMLGKEKDGHFMFFFTHTFNAVNFARSTSTSLLVVDRCLCLRISTKYSRNYSFIVWVKVVLCAASLLLYIGLQTWAEWPLAERTKCDVPLCLLQKDNGFVSSLMRIILALLTLFASLLFHISIKQFASGTMMMSRQQFRNINLLIAISVGGELFLNLIPNLIKVGSAMLALNIWTTLGPFSAIVNGVDALINAVVYRYLLKQQAPQQVAPSNFQTLYT